MFGESVLVKLLSVFLIIGAIKPCLSKPVYNLTLSKRSKYACAPTTSWDELDNFIYMSDTNMMNGQKGIPLHLIIRVINAITCSPLPGVYVDIWHKSADAKKYLRNEKSTNLQGDVRFATVIPGWSNDEAIHVSIRIFHNNNTIYQGRLFFDENLSDGSKLESILLDTESYRNVKYEYMRYEIDPFYRSCFSNGDTLLSLTTIGTGFQTIVTIIVDPEKY